MLSNNTFLKTRIQRLLDGLFFAYKGIGVHVQRMLKMSRGFYTGGNFKQNAWKRAKENWGPYLQSCFVCADPGIFVRGGGGGPGQSDKKKLRNFFFLVLSLLYRSQMVNFKENYHFQGSGGGPTFSEGGGVQLFPGGGGPIAYSLKKPI